MTEEEEFEQKLDTTVENRGNQIITKLLELVILTPIEFVKEMSFSIALLKRSDKVILLLLTLILSAILCIIDVILLLIGNSPANLFEGNISLAVKISSMGICALILLVLDYEKEYLIHTEEKKVVVNKPDKIKQEVKEKPEDVEQDIEYPQEDEILMEFSETDEIEDNNNTYTKELEDGKEELYEEVFRSDEEDIRDDLLSLSATNTLLNSESVYSKEQDNILKRFLDSHIK